MKPSLERASLLLLLAVAVLLAPGAAAQDPHASHGEAGESASPGSHGAHRATPHADHALGSEFRIVRILEPPVGFKGNLAYDRESGRLWLMSFGPPANTKGPSRLLEVDPEDGKVLQAAQMPFLGEFGAPVYIEGSLYQLIAHESKVYRISVQAESFGEILDEIPLPTLNDIEYDGEEPLRFPFISFRGLSRTPEGQLLAHAQDLGEFFVLDRTTGEVRERVQTLRALGGIAATPGKGGSILVLANSDPVRAAFEYQVRRMMFRAEHGIVPSVRYGKEALHWVLLDARSGEILASLRRLDPETDAGSITLVDHRPVSGAPFGRFTFLATGDDGVFTLEWTPGKRS